MLSNKHKIAPPSDEKKVQVISNLSLLQLHTIISAKVKTGDKLPSEALTLINKNNKNNLSEEELIQNLRSEPEKAKQFWGKIDTAKERLLIKDSHITNVLTHKDKLSTEKERKSYNEILALLLQSYFNLGFIEVFYAAKATTIKELSGHTTTVFRYYSSMIKIINEFSDPTDFQKKSCQFHIESYFSHIVNIFSYGLSLAKKSDTYIKDFANPELLKILSELNEYATLQIQQKSPFKIFNKLRLLCCLHLYPFDIEILEKDLLAISQEEKSTAPEYQKNQTDNLIEAFFNIIYIYKETLNRNIKTPQIAITSLPKKNGIIEEKINVESLTEDPEIDTESNGNIESIRITQQSSLVLNNICKNLSPQSKYISALANTNNSLTQFLLTNKDTLNTELSRLNKNLNKEILCFHEALDLKEPEQQAEKINITLNHLVKLQDQFTQLRGLLHYPAHAQSTMPYRTYSKNLRDTLALVSSTRQLYFQYDQDIMDMRKSMANLESCYSRKEVLIKIYKTVINIIALGVNKNINDDKIVNCIVKNILIIYAKLVTLLQNNESYFSYLDYFLLHRPPQIINAIESILIVTNELISSRPNQQVLQSLDSDKDFISGFLTSIISAIEKSLIKSEYSDVIKATTLLISLINLYKNIPNYTVPITTREILSKATDLRACASFLNKDFKTYQSDISKIAQLIIPMTFDKLDNSSFNGLMLLVCKIKQAKIAFDLGTSFALKDTNTELLRYNLKNSAITLKFAIEHYEDAEYVLQNPESVAIKEHCLALQPFLYAQLIKAYEALIDIRLKQTHNDFEVSEIISARKEIEYYSESLMNATTPSEKKQAQTVKVKRLKTEDYTKTKKEVEKKTIQLDNSHNFTPKSSQPDEKKLQEKRNLSLLELNEIVLTHRNKGSELFLNAKNSVIGRNGENTKISFVTLIEKITPTHSTAFWKKIEEAKKHYTIKDTVISDIFAYKNKLDDISNTSEMYNTTLESLIRNYFLLADLENLFFLKIPATIKEYLEHIITVYKYYSSIISLLKEFINPTDLNYEAYNLFTEYTPLCITDHLLNAFIYAKKANASVISYVDHRFLSIIHEINQYAIKQEQESGYAIFNVLQVLCLYFSSPFSTKLFGRSLHIVLERSKFPILTKKFSNIESPYQDDLPKHLLDSIYDDICTYIASLILKNKMIKAIHIAEQSICLMDKFIKNSVPSIYIESLKKSRTGLAEFSSSQSNKLDEIMISLDKDFDKHFNDLITAGELEKNPTKQTESIKVLLNNLLKSQDKLAEISALQDYPIFNKYIEHCNILLPKLYRLLSEVNYLRMKNPEFPAKKIYHNQAIIDVKKLISYYENRDCKKDELIAVYDFAITIYRSGITQHVNNPSTINDISANLIKLSDKIISLAPNAIIYLDQALCFIFQRPAVIISAISTAIRGASLFISSLQQDKEKPTISHSEYNSLIATFFNKFVGSLQHNLSEGHYSYVIAGAFKLISLIKMHDGLLNYSLPDYSNIALNEASRLQRNASILRTNFKSYSPSHKDAKLEPLPSFDKLMHTFKADDERLQYFYCKIEQADVAFKIGDEGNFSTNQDDEHLYFNLGHSAKYLNLAVKHYKEAESILEQISASDDVYRDSYLSCQARIYKSLMKTHSLLKDIYLKKDFYFNQVDEELYTNIMIERENARHYAELLLSATMPSKVTNKSTLIESTAKKVRKKFKAPKISFAPSYKLSAEQEKERRLAEEIKQQAIATEKAAKQAKELAEATAAIEAKKAADAHMAEQLRLEQIRQEDIAKNKKIEQEERAKRDALKQQKKIAEQQARAAAEIKRAEEEAKRDAALEKQWQKNLAEAAKIKADKAIGSTKAQREFEKKAFLNTIISNKQLDALFNLAMDLKNNLGADVEFGGSLIPKLALFLYDKKKTPIAISDIDIFVRSKQSKPHIYTYTPLNSNKEIKATLSDRLISRKFVERIRSDAKEHYTPPFSNHQRIIKKTSDSNELKIDLTVSYPGDKPKENLIPFTEQRMIFSDKEDKDPKSICIQFATGRYLVLKNHPHRDKFIENCEQGKFWLDELPDPYNINVTGYFDRLYGAYNKIKGKLKKCSQTTKALSEPWQVAYFTRRFFAKTSKYQMPCYLEMAQLIRKGRIQKDDYRQPLQSFCLAALLHRDHNKEITDVIDRYYKEEATNKLSASAEKNIIAEIHNTCKNQGMILLAENITTILQLFYQKHPVESETIATTSIKDLFIRISKNLFDNRWNLQTNLTKDELQSWVKKLEISEKLCSELSSPSESPNNSDNSDSPSELSGYEENGLFGAKKASTLQRASSLSPPDTSLLSLSNHQVQTIQQRNKQG